MAYPKTRILKPGDPEYRKHLRTRGVSRLFGDIKLTEYDFKCRTCDRIISFEDQCVIEVIQKNVGEHVLPQEVVDENFETVKAKIDRKKKIRQTIGTVFFIILAFLCIISGNIRFRLFSFF